MAILWRVTVCQPRTVRRLPVRTPLRRGVPSEGTIVGFDVVDFVIEVLIGVIAANRDSLEGLPVDRKELRSRVEIPGRIVFERHAETVVRDRFDEVAGACCGVVQVHGSQHVQLVFRTPAIEDERAAALDDEFHGSAGWRFERTPL